MQAAVAVLGNCLTDLHSHKVNVILLTPSMSLQSTMVQVARVYVLQKSMQVIPAGQTYHPELQKLMWEVIVPQQIAVGLEKAIIPWTVQKAELGVHIHQHTVVATELFALGVLQTRYEAVGHPRVQEQVLGEYPQKLNWTDGPLSLVQKHQQIL